MNKNDIVTVEITDIGVSGEGIGHVDGYTLFIKDAVIGDVVEAKVMKAKKNYGYARLMKVITPSEYRVEPKCAFARRCGGCQIQEMSYDRQLVFKDQKIRGNLERIGGFTKDQIDTVMQPVVGMEHPFGYRNKAQFPFGTDKEGNPITGFYAGRTHDIIANTDCALGVEQNKEILEIILQYMRENKIKSYDEKTGKGLIRHALIRYGFKTKEIMVCLVINGKKLPKAERLIEKLIQIEGMTSITISPNTRRDNVIMGDSYEILWGQGYITDYIGNVKYQISPLSFYQVNPVQTEKLYGLALEYADLKGDETVWDLYCGIGTISLFLAQKAKQVYGVEIVPQAIDDAKENAKINAIDNAEFFVGKAEEVLPEYYAEYEREHNGETAHADVIVVDPPRKGCDETLLETIVKMQPEKVVYVSCDSATLARDLKYLCANGYEIKMCRGVDQFPQSVHVETVVLLSQQKPDDTIEIDLDLDELDATSAELKATYQEIKDYVLKEFGLKVSSLYISQVKRKCGIEVGENYNLPKSENARVPQCPKEKEEAIKAALKYFAMI
ncbi:23S rRNA (uracil(1939)-C(5))-methyltransferase RlmD [Mediterraneibacter sp. 210702-DFI.3.120]|uniref:23S rRNA (uracil(1939)-C(5))-methyltransferase RlmD n=1 Tax=Mediterraneibacter TaxID=2316020 RepID=UPI001D030FE8|nr:MULTISPECIES: 23S rRNA (uracil(1939)-C(5))-methyltransferase RlmD [Mediterraneibacter]MCB5937640.1 23S rRNA (uracil(1939)-C(5))-methyltransferase RlmD [Lachnospiraceae bacterium 210521-DFI.3.107]MCB5561408.1 23S rRNA (uracil(1939)-C(5))-methyltransferase RlmD [Mediterraneibacter faecis]MCB5567493.1 23S rRNA (uracil(1939)-C(5))-methyltransferase RlmD [Mediterraneibacter faecis]MCB5578272.1 23S rRNA (uracil(1939)-C(5))-methyltransferase RlmD [Mediterraneibacter faecis]MCB5585184.1 23S rRNA (u